MNALSFKIPFTDLSGFPKHDALIIAEHLFAVFLFKRRKEIVRQIVIKAARRL